MLRYEYSSISDKIKKYALQSIYNSNSIDKYNNKDTNSQYPYPYNMNLATNKDGIAKYSFFSGLLIAFLAGYHFRLLIECKNKNIS